MFRLNRASVVCMGRIYQLGTMKNSLDKVHISDTSSPPTTRVLQLRDEHGKGMDLAQYEEVVHPVGRDIPLQLRKIRQFQYKDGDLFLCSYPKSGTHWMTTILHILRHAHTKEEIASCEIPMIPFMDYGAVRRVSQMPCPRLMASHLQLHRLPVEHVKNGGKIILMLRNPKDVAVSLYYHMKNQDVFQNQQSWDGFLKSFMRGEVLFGSFWSYVRSWQKVITEQQHKNLMVVYYEDLMQDCVKELKKVQAFLGIDRSDDTLRHIERRCSYKGLHKAIASGQMPIVVKDLEGGQILLRKGQIGDWRTHFTQQQSEDFDKFFQERLGDCIFKFQYDSVHPQHKL